MSFPFPELRRRTLGRALMLALALIGIGASSGATQGRELRVCADPNNLPFSNQRLEGFENRISALLAQELGATVHYTWWAQRRGFIRNTLRAGTCDVVMGAPRDWDEVETTRPYYRSTYVFVYRSDSGLDIHSLDDPVLRCLTIAVHTIGDSYHNTPPGHALARRGIVRNVVGYSIYGDYSQDNPPLRLIEAVASRAVDVAVVWGPFTGRAAEWFGAPLTVVPITPESEPPFRFAYDIALGVRKNDTALKQELDDALDRRAPEIRRILAEYGVPLVSPGAGGARQEERP
jgi:mxaJ protein